MTIEELVRESTTAQGVPEFVEDPEVLTQIAAIVRTPNERGTQGQPGSFGLVPGAPVPVAPAVSPPA